MRNIKKIFSWLFLSGLVCFSMTEETYRSKIDSQIYMTLDNGHFELYCMGNGFDQLDFQPHPWINDIEEAYLVNCKPPNMSLITAMEQIKVNIKTTKHLELYTGSLPRVSNFEGLVIQELGLCNMFGRDSLKLSLDVIEPLHNLTKLNVRMFNILPSQNIKGVISVNLSQGKSLGGFGECKELENLNIRRWKFEMIPEEWLVNCSKLKTLSIQEIRDGLTKEQLRKAIVGANSLQELVVSEAGLTEFPKDLFVYVKNLTKLDLSNNEMSPNITLSDIQLKLLSHLNLDQCKIVELVGFPLSESPVVEINLRGNEIKDWQLHESDYERIKRKTSAKILSDEHGVSLNCDCHHAQLALAVRESLLNVSSKIECSDGQSIMDVDRDVVECTMYKCENCTCRRHWSDDKVVARCMNTTRVPHEKGLFALYAVGNEISALSPEDLPPTLLNVDLRRNRLTNLDQKTLEVMFNVSARVVNLAGNPLECGCDNLPMIKSLKEHSNQVEDYSNTTCFGNGRPINETDEVDLCSSDQKVIKTVIISVCAVFLGMIAISTALFCRYRHQVKVFLYSRGCCLKWLREEEIDSDRIYDAFVSFSHGDEAFVIEKLLPILDREYKLCLHFRDWVIGDFIPAQITRSVQQSRRTVIVLSRKFVESVWGLLEFRTAHMSAIQEGRARIIVVVIDDVVDDEDLDGELRSYVKNNTYVQWGDRWFWDKLRFAMPHSRLPASVPLPTHATNIDMTYPIITLTPGMEMAVLPMRQQHQAIMPV